MYAHQPVLRLPGAGGHFSLDGKGLLRVGGRAVFIDEEVIDKFLNTHRIVWRLLVVIQEAANIRIQSRVHIDGISRKRLVSDELLPLLIAAGEGFFSQLAVEESAEIFGGGRELLLVGAELVQRPGGDFFRIS
jgi:hypothetical protein